MKHFLLSFGFAALTLSAAAQTVYFEEDFEWIEPWAKAGNGTPAGATVEENNSDAKAPQIIKCVVNDVTLYQALLDKGYSFEACHSELKSDGTKLADRKPEEQVYAQANYLKFGLTNYYSSITFPAIEAFGDGVTDAEISFDWCTIKQGSGAYDKSLLVVVVENGDDVKKFDVEPLEIADKADYKWYPTKVSLAGATLNKTTKITIRNADSQWPAQTNGTGKNLAYRYLLDNIKITAAEGSGVASIEADENMPVEYYNLQGVKVANPENGLYIVKQGNKVSKRFVK